jgi:hypothetical protein
MLYGCCSACRIGRTRRGPTFACGKDGAPSGADELGVELAKWYHPGEAMANEDYPAASSVKPGKALDHEKVGHPPCRTIEVWRQGDRHMSQLRFEPQP